MQLSRHGDRSIGPSTSRLRNTIKKRLATGYELRGKFRTQPLRQLLGFLVESLFARRLPNFSRDRISQRPVRRGRAVASQRRMRLEFLEPRALLTWIGATSGSTIDAAHDYNNTANWAGGTIDDSFNGVSFTADTVLWFSADRATTAAGFNFNYNGAANLTLRSSVATPIVLTLNDGVSGDFGGPANNKSVIILGSTSNPVNIVLPSGTHSIAVASGDSLQLAGAISGAGDLTKTGSGTVVLSNSTNSYAGATNINAGTLNISANNSIPSTSAVSLVAGATLNVNSLSDTIGSLSSTGVVGSVTISNGGTGYGSAPTVTFSGGGGSGAVGTAIISGGVVTGVTITNSGTGYTSVPSVTFSAPASGTTASGTAVVSGGSVTLGAGTLSTGANNASTTFVGVISGTGTLTKAGSGTFNLTNTNTYGATQILAGTLQIGNGGNSGTLGAGSGSITNNAQLTYNRALGPGNALTISAVISGSGRLTVTVGQLNLSGACTYSGATTIDVGGQLFLGAGTATGSLNPNSTILNNGRLGFQRSNTITQGTDFASVVSGTGNILKSTASGTVVLNGLNTYSSFTDISVGTVQINTIQNVGGGASALGAPTSTAGGSISIGTPGSNGAANLVYVGTGNTTDRRVNFAGTSSSNPPTITQSGTGLLKFTGPIVSGAGSKTLTLSGSTAGTGEISGAIPNNSSTNTTSVVKSGTGIWTLSGTNTYTGTTTINDGTLLVNGSIASSTTTVNSGGKLGGSGTTGAITVNSGGILAPGNSPGKLNSGNVAFASGSTFSAEVNNGSPTIAGTTHDQLNVTGTVSLNGASLSLGSSTISVPPSKHIVLINNDGSDAVTGTFNGLSEGSPVTINGIGFFITYVGGDGNDVVLKSPGLASADIALTSVQLVQNISPFNPIDTTAPVIGEQVYVKASYTTQNLPASASYRLEAKMDGVPISVTRTDGAGCTSCTWTRVWGGWFASPGPHSIELTIDADNSQDEANEANNTLATPITFTPVSPDTLPNKFINPMGGALYRDWTFVNYVDVERATALPFEDFNGGVYTYDGHEGHDISPPNFDRMDAGIPEYAAAAGMVEDVHDGEFDRWSETPPDTTPANYIVIDHGSGWKTRYFHIAANTIAVKIGGQVQAGQFLGFVGSSGHSDGAHLHFDVTHNGAFVETMYDPTDYYVSPLPYQASLPKTILDAGITNGGQPTTSEFDEQPSEHAVFSTTTPKNAVFWFYLSHINTGDTYQVKWYRPNGTLQTTSNFTASTTIRGSWNWWTLSSSTIGASPGTWRVAMEMGGIELVSRSFTVTTGAGTPGVKVAKGASAIITNRTTPWDFGSIAVGGVAPSQTFTITNFGTAPLSLSNLALPPGFSLGSFPTSLAAGATGNLTVNLTTNTPGYNFGAIQFTTNDPDRPTFNFNVSGTVTGTAAAGAPVLSLPAPALAYTTLGQASVIDPSATVTDSDSANFAGGSLKVEFTYVSSLHDMLGIQSTGNGAGQIGVSGTSVTYEGVPIGTFAGGMDTAPLFVSFNGNATLAAAQALLRSIAFSTTATDSATLARYVRFTLVDESGNVSNLPFAVVDQDLRPTTLSLEGGDLIIADSSRAGKNDNWRLERVGDYLVLTDVTGNTIDVSSIPGSSGNPTSAVTVPLSVLSAEGRLELDMRDGVDVLTIDVSSGVPIPAGGIFYVGNPPLGRGDKLIIEGGAAGTVTYNVDTATSRFVGLPEASAVEFGATTLFVTYTAGDGNDVAIVNYPPIAEAGGPYLAAEGGSIQLNGSGSSDPYPPGAPLSYQWDLDGDNVFGETGPNAERGDEIGVMPTFSAAGLDGPGDYLVRWLRVTDIGDLSDEVDFAIQITNVEPTIHDVFNSGPVDEGSSATVTVVADDPAGIRDPLSYEFDFDNDGVFEVGPQSGSSAMHTFGDDGVYPVNVRVTDDDGGVDISHTIVTVNNVNPTIDEVSNSGPVDEGSSFTVTVTASDVAEANDPLSYEFDFDDDGIYEVGPQASSTAAHTYGENGTYQVHVRVTDGDVGEAVGFTLVMVNNVAPTADAGADQTVNEGDTINLLGAFSDPGTADTHTQIWSVVATNGQTIADGSGSSFSFVPNDNGTYTVTYTVTDDDGGTDSDTVVVTVNNVAPTADAGADQTVNEGDTVHLSGAFTDLGSADTHTQIWSVAASNGQVIGGGSGPSYSFTPNDNGTYTVTYTVTDDDGGIGGDTVIISVNNVSPTAHIVGPDDGIPLQLLGFTLSATDPSLVDEAAPFIFSIDWGDGSPPQTPTPSPTHAYADVGTYTVSVTAKDKDNGTSTTATHVIHVVYALMQGQDLLVGGTGGADAISISQALGGNVHVTVNAQDIGAFAVHGQVRLWAYGGDDTIAVAASGVAGATLDAGEGSDAYTIQLGNVGAPVSIVDSGIVGADTLFARGTDNPDNIEKLDGIVKLDGVVKVLFTGINHVTIDGAAGNDRIIDPGYDTTILGGPGDDTITINATTGTGVNVDGGSGSDAYIIGGGLIGDLAGPVTIADTGATGADSVTVLGTGSNDSIAETSSGFGLNGTSITVAGLETALVDGGGGSSDQIIATGTPPIPVEVRHVSDMVVVGTAGNDQILFDPGTLPGEVVGRLNGAIVSRFIPTGKIVAYGGAGDDNIQVAGSIALPAWLYGEAGNDRLNAGNGGSLLIGGEGNDRLLGGGGRDVMIGGNGADSLVGNNSDDILVAGFTTMDDRSAAGHEEFWCDVISEWNSSRTFNERVNNLRDGTGSAIPSNNGSFLKLNVTVLDDMFGDEIDFLNGAAGEDWLIFSMVEDKVSGQVEASN